MGERYMIDTVTVYILLFVLFLLLRAFCISSMGKTGCVRQAQPTKRPQANNNSAFESLESEGDQLLVSDVLQQPIRENKRPFEIDDDKLAWAVPLDATRLSVDVVWAPVDVNGQSLEADLDASVVLFDASGPRETFAVYYRNKSAKGMEHTRINATDIDGDNGETIHINLTEIPSSTEHLFITLNIFNPPDVKFKDIVGLGCRLYDHTMGTKQQIVSFIIENGGVEDWTGLVLAHLIKRDTYWSFKKVNRFTDGREYSDMRGEMLEIRDGVKRRRMAEFDDASLYH